MQRLRSFVSLSCLSGLLAWGLAGGCGSVTPLSSDASGGAGTMGAAGTGGVAGTRGTAGATGAAGMTGVAGASGGAGATGAGGMSGRVPAKHRAAAVACAHDRGAGACSGVDAGVPQGSYACRTDADCTAGANGRCGPLGRIVGCACTYDACFSDADCTTGGPCVCRTDAQTIIAPMTTTANACLAGNCRVDPDCGAGGYCSPTLGSCGNYSGVVGYYCHTTKDKCVDDADCAAQGGGDCRFSPTAGAWDCETSQCAG